MMSARDTIEAALRGAAGWGDSPRVDDLLTGYRGEVLSEVTAWLTKKAREFRAAGERQQADTAALLASKVARGAVRPNNLRMLPASFFEPDRIYERPRWRFECHAVAPNPDDGQLRAIGFLYRVGGMAMVIGLGCEDWAKGWTEAADGGEA